MKLGLTLLDVNTFENNDTGELVKERPVLTEALNGTWAITYQLKKKFSIEQSRPSAIQKLTIRIEDL